MAMTFDATLKEMARECPEGFLAAFDRRPATNVSVLDVDLSTVTATADTMCRSTRSLFCCAPRRRIPT